MEHADILAIGEATAMAERYTADTIIDAVGQIVMPGLINGHVHTPDSLFRSLVEDLPLEAWLHKLFSAEQRFVSSETVELGSRLSIAEMISGGITAALDTFWFPERSAKAAKEIGFRLMTGPIYFDPVDIEKRGLESHLSEGRFKANKGARPGVFEALCCNLTTVTNAASFMEDYRLGDLRQILHLQIFDPKTIPCDAAAIVRAHVSCLCGDDARDAP